MQFTKKYYLLHWLFFIVLNIISVVDVTAQASPAEFKSYKELIPGTSVSFELVPIQAGEFLMGSPVTEAGRKEDEGPQHKVKIEPFWMSSHEVSWDEFEIFVYREIEKQSMNASSMSKTSTADAVSRPSPPYLDMTFGMGKNGFPAVNMTQFAALTYCKWLTAKTGQFYRLPTEAEWEYACRTGSTTAYAFGDDKNKLDDYAWSYNNSQGGTKKVGSKKPNAWGLYDMHGNVAEWTLDQYNPDYYAQFTKGAVTNPWLKPTKLYAHALRGGSWDDDPAALRSAARQFSKSVWKQRDPQIPKSQWWFTDAPFVGFRVVRPLKQPSPEEIAKYWAEPIKDFGG
ncbi:MAG: sulfatase-modifying factor protein [Cytophagales bacterium CG18_big_fil_WC_8_21_14_2_50_42_9]|nr:MAG: sulfatase-modifying factor protein [Cytophagales bacterium CG18_big_fil_WC_8_21_14_2_50_42_9]